MQKIPIEYYNLNLFEQLDRPVIAFVKKRPFRKVENLHVFASTEAYEKERRKFEITGYKAQTIPLGMSLDAVIWQPYYVNLVISGLDTSDIIFSKDDLQPLKDLIDSFCIMFAATNAEIENAKAYELMKNKTVYFLGQLLAKEFKVGDRIGFEGIQRESDGKHYVSVKCFLTRESAEKFNMNNRPVTPANLGYLKYFWCKPVIIEPHRNYWIEFL